MGKYLPLEGIPFIFPIKVRLDEHDCNEPLILFTSFNSSPEILFSTIFAGIPFSPWLSYTRLFPTWYWMMISRTLRQQFHILVNFCAFTLLHAFLKYEDRALCCLTLQRWYVLIFDWTVHHAPRSIMFFKVTLELGYELQCYILPSDTHCNITWIYLYHALLRYPSQ